MNLNNGIAKRQDMMPRPNEYLRLLLGSLSVFFMKFPLRNKSRDF